MSVDGPYNEHLLRDFGQGNLAFGMVALVALLTGGVWLARATGLAAVVANLPHQAYHQTHLHVLPTMSDQVLQTITLSFVSVTSILLAVLAFLLPVGLRTRVQPTTLAHLKGAPDLARTRPSTSHILAAQGHLSAVQHASPVAMP